MLRYNFNAVSAIYNGNVSHHIIIPITSGLLLVITTTCVKFSSSLYFYVFCWILFYCKQQTLLNRFYLQSNLSKW